MACSESLTAKSKQHANDSLQDRRPEGSAWGTRLVPWPARATQPAAAFRFLFWRACTAVTPSKAARGRSKPLCTARGISSWPRSSSSCTKVAPSLSPRTTSEARADYTRRSAARCVVEDPSSSRPNVPSSPLTGTCLLLLLLLLLALSPGRGSALSTLTRQRLDFSFAWRLLDFTFCLGGSLRRFRRLLTRMCFGPVPP